MTKKKAISVLRAHGLRLASIADYDYDHLYLWQQQALAYVGNLLGTDSQSYVLIQSFRFPDVQAENYDRTVAILKTRIEECLEQAIDTIENIGVLQKPYHNFLCRYSDKELFGFIVGGASVVFGAGIAIGRWLITHRL